MHTMEENTMKKYKHKKAYSSSYCHCFFCAIKGSNRQRRRSNLLAFFGKLPFRDHEEDVLVMSVLWSIAMANPDDTEIPYAGALRCMSLLITKGLSDPNWLRRKQNIYIPYYAAHVLGSYTLRLPSLASLAVESGAIPPLLGLLRGRMTWVEQRVAVRTLSHLASYDETFPAVACYAEELIGLAIDIASNCINTVYNEFFGEEQREKYHRDLLTRGLGGVEMEDRKAEEWASQLQCWSIYLLSCFASRDSTYHHWICRDAEFFKKLCKMWGGMVNGDSPAGTGLMRILCRSGGGRETVAGCTEAIESLCNLSRSSDDWQYMGIDCLLLLVDDPNTRWKVANAAVPCLLDLSELRSLGPRKNIGEVITKTLLLNFDLDLMVERVKKEEAMLEEEIMQKKALAVAKRKKGNESIFSGDVEEAAILYTEALEECPLKMRKERMVLYSNRAQCWLLMQEPDAAISDATRALSLSAPANTHGKSLWRRAQAYDMKGMAKESLMDCIIFVSGWINMMKDQEGGKRAKVPYYAAHMINKQMSAAGLFAAPLAMARRKKELEGAKMDTISGFGLPTIEEEPIAYRPRREKERKMREGGLASNHGG